VTPRRVPFQLAPPVTSSWLEKVGTALAALGVLACGGGSQTPAPQSLNETIAHFMAAVKTNDLQRMGALWGSERGPAIQWMKGNELRQRLAVIQKYLSHEGYQVIEGPLPVPGKDNVRTFRLELQRSTGCNVAFPIDLVRAKSGGWLVNDVHLDVIGTPAATCRP
jgi:hypothetical protein